MSALSTLPFEEVAGQPLNEEQRSYLNGLFAGLRNRGQTFSDVAPPTPVVEPSAVFEERVKRELHPLDAYPLLLEHAAGNRAPERENIFRFKWNGLFHLTPNKEGFMARLRIPGGVIRSFQIRELGKIAQQLTTGYIQVTNRANLQLRMIAPKDAPEFLQRIQAIGLHSRGSGGDNIRNLTVHSTAGIDPHELINTLPHCYELAQIIINDRSFYDLPRKFNIAIDGGGSVGCVEDTNDIGARAVRVEQRVDSLTPGVYFRISVGGATGHKAFARDLGILVAPEKLVSVIVALVRIYLANGNRNDRKKARLKHLLEQWPLEKYLAETEKLLGYALPRSLAPEEPKRAAAHSHIGVYPQKQAGLNYIGALLPVGQLTAKQLLRLADLAEHYGSGELRLTVWQNVIIPDIPIAYVETVSKALRKMGFSTQSSYVRGGLVACTGNSYCKFAASNTKGHAGELADHLERKVMLDQPINIHLTGCPNSCAQHYMGDIGLLGTKVKVGGESVEGYHVFVGGGFGAHQALGRQVFQNISVDELKPTLEKMLQAYLKHRSADETFQAFTTRHDLNSLQVVFSGDAALS